MASKLNFDGNNAQSAEAVDCAHLERMSLSEMLYHVLTKEGSPFRMPSTPRAA
jgi:hypothetical protein